MRCKRDPMAGRVDSINELFMARAGIATGIGLFFEAHPNPNEAKCNGQVHYQLIN